ncbi:TPR-like protein [Hyaloscypha bicolor E]|uniref:TPR-like protein n=1 Tax=Hyaloscypha bicolor E TaxID=1095630 RepID=A0A2J6TRE4_9HELO|nr:TPR-like protein [Hyaloscypha bicolor E]PMD65589.1 TPR-like protein [Hyaloscypha bicolor E]
MSNFLIDDRMQDLRGLGPEDIIQLGLLCEQQLKVKQSIACFNYLTHSPPDFVDKVSWWLKIAPTLEQSGKFDIAKKMYKLVLERNSENVEAMKNLGRLYHQEDTSQENQDRAIRYLERAVALDKGNTQSWYLLGCSYLSRQFLFKAHEAFQQAIYRDQKNVDCWASLGALNVKMKRYKEAQNSYDTAIKLDRRRVESWVNLGNLMRQLGQIPKAIDSFKVASNLDPSNAEVQKYLRELIDASDGQ